MIDKAGEKDMIETGRPGRMEGELEIAAID